jgi:restriction system protein
MQKKNKKGNPGVWKVLFPIICVLGLAAWGMPNYRYQLVSCLVLILLICLVGTLRKLRLTSKMTEIDAMSGHDFERYLARLFKKLGYKTKLVGTTGGDFGADLIMEKDRIKIAVQAKNYNHRHKVGNDAVQQAVAGASYYDCEQAWVVTNSTFTRAARKQAVGSNIHITLWDRTTLKSKLARLR